MRFRMVGAFLWLCASAAALPDDDLAVPSRALLAMTPDDFARTASVKDDALEVRATITTEPGYLERHGLLRIVQSDNFLRAFVDKTSGRTTFQLYQQILYVRRLYKYFDSVNYETPTGPRAVETINLGRIEHCLRSAVLVDRCTRIESVAVPLDEPLLKTIAAGYAPGNAATWHFRFKAQSGDDFDGVMVPAEVAGLLQAIADYKRTHGLTMR